MSAGHTGGLHEPVQTLANSFISFCVPAAKRNASESFLRCQSKSTRPWPGAFAQLVKKVPGQDFFDCAFPPSILAEHKMLFSKSLEKQGFSKRRAIGFEAGLAPSSSPAALSILPSARFFDSLSKSTRP